MFIIVVIILWILFLFILWDYEITLVSLGEKCFKVCFAKLHISSTRKKKSLYMVNILTYVVSGWEVSIAPLLLKGAMLDVKGLTIAHAY